MIRINMGDANLRIYPNATNSDHSDVDSCHSCRSKGYVALSSILVIAAVVLTIGISVSLLAVSESQMSLAEKKKEETIDFVEGCVEDALLRLNKDGAIPTQIPLPQGTCDVIINSQSGNDWIFTTSGSTDNYTKSIQVSAVRDTEVSISSWLEVE